MSHVNDRLAALEAGLRRSRIINRLLGVALVGLFTIAATTGGYTPGMDATFGTIWAKKVVVVNEAGTPQATMGCNETGGMVSILNPAGMPQAAMACNETGGVVSILNPAGTPLAAMACYEDGGMVSILNPAGMPLATMGCDKVGGMVSIRNRKGQGRTLTPGP